MRTLADDKLNDTQKFKFKLLTIENIVGKGENAHLIHTKLAANIFSLSHNVFESLFFSVVKTRDCWLIFRSVFTIHFTTQSRVFKTLKKTPFENIVGKVENAGNQHFLLFPQCFLPFQRTCIPFEPQ